MEELGLSEKRLIEQLWMSKIQVGRAFSEGILPPCQWDYLLCELANIFDCQPVDLLGWYPGVYLKSRLSSPTIPAWPAPLVWALDSRRPSVVSIGIHKLTGHPFKAVTVQRWLRGVLPRSPGILLTVALALKVPPIRLLPTEARK